jgi:hypothetical protein
MIKTLVAIEVDLASSMAIRYACQLGNLIQMELYPVYVKPPPPEVPSTGTGWVRHTWEREIVEMGKEEIQEMLASEMETCPLMQEPRVIYGDREYELLKIVDQEKFNLYVEGAPYPFNPVTIYKRLHFKFYQKLASPLIWLRILRKINQVLVVCLDPPGTRSLVRDFQTLWSGCSTPLHLAVPPQDNITETLRQEVQRGREALEAAGCQVVLQEAIPATGWGPPVEIMQDYGLVAVSLERALKKDSPQLQWLTQVKAPLMLTLYG